MIMPYNNNNNNDNDNVGNDNNNNISIGKAYVGASYSCIVVIPKNLSDKYNLLEGARKKRAYVMFEDTGKGVLITKFRPSRS